MREIRIRELTFSAAHYLPGHPKCSAIHGHTYVIRNLVIRYPEDEFVDFGEIKHIIKGWDHRFIVPRKDAKIWEAIAERLFMELQVAVRLKVIDGDPTVENIARELAREIKESTAAEEVHLELYEGFNQGAVV